MTFEVGQKWRHDRGWIVEILAIVGLKLAYRLTPLNGDDELKIAFKYDFRKAIDSMTRMETV